MSGFFVCFVLALGALVTGCGEMGDAADPVPGKQPVSLEAVGDSLYQQGDFEIGRASCRERV